MSAKQIIAGLALVLFLAVLFALPLLAQVGGGFDLSWNSIDGGGATFSTGGNITLAGTIGQADAGTASGGAYTLVSGFWVGAIGAPPGLDYSLYLPVVLK